MSGVRNTYACRHPLSTEHPPTPPRTTRLKSNLDIHPFACLRQHPCLIHFSLGGWYNSTSALYVELVQVSTKLSIPQPLTHLLAMISSTLMLCDSDSPATTPPEQSLYDTPVASPRQLNPRGPSLDEEEELPGAGHHTARVGSLRQLRDQPAPTEASSAFSRRG